jgi:hypothetical protein
MHPCLAVVVVVVVVVCVWGGVSQSAPSTLFDAGETFE